MNDFQAKALRLKQVLGVPHDKDLAAALGMQPSPWAQRQRRNSFPEAKLWALSAKRPDLAIDVEYVLTGQRAGEKTLVTMGSATGNFVGVVQRGATVRLMHGGAQETPVEQFDRVVEAAHVLSDNEREMFWIGLAAYGRGFLLGKGVVS